MSNYTAKKGQSIYDVCLQTYGTLSLLSNKESALFKLINDNNISNINTGDLSGKVFIFDENLIFDFSLFSRNIEEKIFYVSVLNKDFYLLQDDGYFIFQDDGFKIIV